MTVGPGIKPGLLTLSDWRPASARGLDAMTSKKTPSHHYRRWGITPRPENMFGCDASWLPDASRQSGIYHA